MNIATNTIELLQGPASSVSLPTQLCAWASGIILSVFALGAMILLISIIYAIVRDLMDK